ncbi:MAG: flavodoxin family protein [Candidatus Bathyarchaeia archaeon]
MKPCIVYFSRTGNTKRLAQAIADAFKAPIFDMGSTQPSALAEFDVLIIGNPVEGASPAKEATAFVENMPMAEGKKVILFCTYRAFGNERAMKKIEKQLENKGYKTVAKVSKKGMKPDKDADFSEVLGEIRKALEKQL